MFDSVKRLEVFPRSECVVPETGQEDIREVLLGSYRIVYVISKEEVNITTVFHASSPGPGDEIPPATPLTTKYQVHQLVCFGLS